jgi:hypothetical protein
MLRGLWGSKAFTICVFIINDLLASTKEGKEILAKKTAPSRTFYVEESNVKKILTKVIDVVNDTE